jgi:hypothetical protein
MRVCLVTARNQFRYLIILLTVYNNYPIAYSNWILNLITPVGS